MDYQKIFENIPHPFWVVKVVGDEFIFEKDNRYYQDLVGFSIEGKRVDESGFSDSGKATIVCNYREVVRRGQVYEYEELINVQGRDRWWLTRMSPEYNRDGKIDRLIGISTEITELKAIMKNMEQFIYIISHDMQTPIKSIAGLVGLLEDKYGASEIIEVIKESAQHANDQIAGLLVYSRALALNRDEFISLNINKIVDVLGQQLDCECVLDREDLLPCWGNKAAITTVFQNLIGNACKFNEQSPVIKIKSQDDGVWVKYTVADNGIGIDPEDFTKIFDPFERLNPEFDGTGLGLSLVRNVIQRHGGDIEVVSPNDLGGSTFLFWIKK